ncbi:unnamed protein product, partial [Rotaria sp. Silwood1]
MVVTTDKQTLDYLLNSVVNEESSTDKVLEDLIKIPLNLIFDYVTHPFFDQHIFRRLEQILQEWLDPQVVINPNDSVAFHRLVQNHVFSEQLVQQNIIPLLIQYAEESPNDEVPLEIIYALLFIANGKKELRKEQYKKFVDHVKQLRQSGKVEVQRAAEGIIWKIEDEDIFKDNFDRQEAYPPPTSTYPPPMSAYPPPMSAYPLPMSTDFPPQSGSL